MIWCSLKACAIMVVSRLCCISVRGAATACFEVCGEGFFVPASLCAGLGGKVLAVAWAYSAAAGRFRDLEGWQEVVR